MKGGFSLSAMGSKGTFFSAGDDFLDFEGIIEESVYPFSSIMSEAKKISQKLENALSRLDAELRTILESKFGLKHPEEGSVHTDRKVAQDLGGTEESVAALEELALRALYTSARKG